jgi:D-aspartate ligase
MATSHLSPAVVCEVGWVNGLTAIRSLGRLGVPVIAVDARPWALGFRSRYAKPLLAPDPLVDEDGFIAALVQLGDRLVTPAPIFPTHDEHLNSLARRRDDLGDRFRYPFPDWATLELVQSKRHQLEVAEQLGFAFPRTLHPRAAHEAHAAAKEIGFPVMVKPSDNIVFKRRYKRQAFVCQTPAELDEAFRLAAEYEPMVQEFIPGGDEHLWTLGTYLAEGGEALAVFSGRKLRQTRYNMGSARSGEALWDEEVVESGLTLLRGLGYHGIAQVEWKRDPRDGSLNLIEVNPRLWQWHSLAAECGADVTLAAYWDLLGLRRPLVRSDGRHKRWAITLMEAGVGGAAFYRPPYIDPVFCRDDPKPGLVHSARFVRNKLRRLSPHLGGR